MIATETNDVPQLLAIADRHLASDRFDPFRHYPSSPSQPALPTEPPPWQTYWRARLQQYAADPQVQFLATHDAIVALRDSTWDRSHFGFGMATLHVLLAADVPDIRLQIAELLLESRQRLLGNRVRFVSTRVNGDHLQVLHALEDAGFRYMDNVIWPVATTAQLADTLDPRVRLIQEADLPRVIALAQAWAYPRGHLYCNGGFAKPDVDAMYGKWLHTAWQNQTPLAVIEDAGVVQGFFQFSVESEGQTPLGLRYGHMRLLVVNGEVRGRGLGQALFNGAMVLMKRMGASHIDSGYSTKNHVSAHVHARAGFLSAHEEVTLHMWLD